MRELDFAEEIGELLAEWRRTCVLLGIRWTDKDAALFVAAATAHRVAPPGEVEC